MSNNGEFREELEKSINIYNSKYDICHKITNMMK